MYRSKLYEIDVRQRNHERKRAIHIHERKRHVTRSKHLLCMFAFFLVLIGSLSFGKVFSEAQDSQTEPLVTYKYYKSIQLVQGDSLWSVAETYMSDHYGSIDEYITELMEMNNLHSDQIYAGQYLTVSYYDQEYK